MVQDQKKDDHPKKPVVGLILVGGGARAAYQVGVLKAISECVPRRGSNPFPVICGTSAGAINGAVLAINAGRFTLGVRRLLRVWRNFRVGHVFEAGTWGIVKSGAHWLLAMMLGGLGRFSPSSLLDRHPLAKLLHRLVPCGLIQDAIDRGDLKAFSVTASGYTSGQSFIFYQGDSDIKPWRRVQRLGIPAKITVKHLLASSAIPFVFEAVKLRREYFGDGSMRQVAPISPALHLGADRVLVIGVRHEKEDMPIRLKVINYPSLAQIAGHVLDSIFLDSLEADLERLTRINKTVSMIPSHHLEEGNVSLRPVEVMVISPGKDIRGIASRYTGELPWALRFLLKSVGALKKNGSNLLSYVLFERGYCRELIDLGYNDTIERKEEILEFLGYTEQKASSSEEHSKKT